MEQDSGYGVIIRYLEAKILEVKQTEIHEKGEPVYQKQGLAAGSS